SRCYPAILNTKQVFFLRQAQHLLTDRFCLSNLIGRGIFWRLSQRHVLFPAAIDQKASFNAKVLRSNAVHLADGWDTFLFELIHTSLNTACSKNTLIVFELQNLRDINRREPTAYDQGFVRSLVVRPSIVFFILVVVPIDEGILVNQTLVDEFFRSGYSQFSVPPRPVCQDYRRKAPVAAKILKVQVAAEPSAGKEENTRLPQTSIDAAVLLFALLKMPAGQTIFNLAIRL